MSRILLASPLPLALFGLSLICCLLSALRPRRRWLWAALTALGTVGGLLAGLVAGAGLEDLLTPLLLTAAVSLRPLTGKEE